MRRDAVLINTSRGSLVDEGGLIGVFEREPALRDLRERVMLLPRLGSATVGVRGLMDEVAVRNAAAALRGEEPPNLVRRT